MSKLDDLVTKTAEQGKDIDNFKTLMKENRDDHKAIFENMDSIKEILLLLPAKLKKELDEEFTKKFSLKYVEDRYKLISGAVILSLTAAFIALILK